MEKSHDDAQWHMQTTFWNKPSGKSSLWASCGGLSGMHQWEVIFIRTTAATERY